MFSKNIKIKRRLIIPSIIIQTTQRSMVHAFSASSLSGCWAAAPRRVAILSQIGPSCSNFVGRCGDEIGTHRLRASLIMGEMPAKSYV